MSSKTPNINLTKPDKTDYVDISVINGNSDIIDTKIKELTDKTGGTTNQLVTITKDTAVGSKSVPIYIDATGKAQTCTELVVDKTNATDTSDKIYLLGAKSQVANTTAYSDNEVSVTNGTLTAKKLVSDTARIDQITIGDIDSATWGVYSSSGISIGGLNGDILELNKNSFAYLTNDAAIAEDTETSFTVVCPDKNDVDKCIIMFWGIDTAKAADDTTNRVIVDSFSFGMEISNNNPIKCKVGYVNTATGCSMVQRSYDETTGNITVYISPVDLSRTGRIRWKAFWLPINGFTQ